MFTGLNPHNNNFTDNQEIFEAVQGSAPTRTHIPTLIDLAGLDVHGGMDGTSYAPVCLNPDEPPQAAHRELYAENENGHMVRFGEYKYIRASCFGEDTETLFHLTADPDEHTNLSGSAKHAEDLAQGRMLLDAWMKKERIDLTFSKSGQ